MEFTQEVSVIFDDFSSGPMCRSSGRPFVAMCSIVLADLKSVGLLAMVELGRASLFPTMLDPPVHAVESFPPPIRGLGMIGAPMTPAATPVPAGMATAAATAAAALPAACAALAAKSAASILLNVV
jgi:hypothetical protein